MTTFQLREIAAADYERWFITHIGELKARSAFHHPGWLHTIAAATGNKIVFVGFFDDDALKIVFPGFIMRYGPVKCFGSPLRGTMTPCLGPVALDLGATSVEVMRWIDLCNSFVRKHWRVAYSEYSIREVSRSLKPSTGFGWEESGWSTYVLDLTQGEQALWKKAETRFRNSIRKCQRLGMKIVPLKQGQNYHGMLNDTLGRRGTSTWHSKAFFDRLLGELPEDCLWAYGVEYENNLVAGGIFIHDDREVHYASGASLSQYRSLPTSYLLHWHIITMAVERGLQVYDLGMRTTANVDLFKRSLSPEIVNHSFLTHSSRLVRVAQRSALPLIPYIRNVNRWLGSKGCVREGQHPVAEKG